MIPDQNLFEEVGRDNLNKNGKEVTNHELCYNEETYEAEITQSTDFWRVPKMGPARNYESIKLELP